jgi:hypothetical protein
MSKAGFSWGMLAAALLVAGCSDNTPSAPVADDAMAVTETPAAVVPAEPEIPDLSTWTCDRVATDVIEIFKGSENEAVKIYSPQFISSAKGEIKCSGTALRTTGYEETVYFRAYLDRDLQVLYEFGVNPM